MTPELFFYITLFENDAFIFYKRIHIRQKRLCNYKV